MTVVILIIALLNLALGFALSMVLESHRATIDAHSMSVNGPDGTVVVIGPNGRPRGRTVADLPQGPDTGSYTAAAELIASDSGKVSPRWMKWLEEQEFEAGSFVEASLQVLRLRVGSYHDRLVEIDTKIRHCAESPSGPALDGLRGEVKEANAEWLDNQGDAAVSLSEHNRKSGPMSEIGQKLEDVLLEQAAQIETTASNLDHLDFATDLTAGCRRLMGEVRKLLDMSHNLRDRMQESMIALFRSQGNLAQMDAGLTLDPLTQLLGPAGFEQVLLRLDEGDREGIVAIYDIDRFGPLLEKAGANATDGLLIEIGHQLAALAKQAHPESTVARFRGQQFGIVLPDMKRDTGLAALERVRESFCATEFAVLGEATRLSISGAASPLRPSEQPEDLYHRLELAIAFAKREVQSVTCCDDGEGPFCVTKK